MNELFYQTLLQGNIKNAKYLKQCDIDLKQCPIFHELYIINRLDVIDWIINNYEEKCLYSIKMSSFEKAAISGNFEEVKYIYSTMKDNKFKSYYMMCITLFTKCEKNENEFVKWVRSEDPCNEYNFILDKRKDIHTRNYIQ